ncbi:hypothetical protein UFOVP315_30 [uncultured Caudovirales phage]|uniref:Uncharacterized protein n=1 Tax=uncultured Caudovirales phage TaxID=2100421 RepID=A0A6J5LS55_9CAUD|nr:hypothetical protein UFOVP315_30 [uncultured Caudovirales phage]
MTTESEQINLTSKLLADYQGLQIKYEILQNVLQQIAGHPCIKNNMGVWRDVAIDMHTKALAGLDLVK